MFIAAQFALTKCCKQPKGPPVNEWIKKPWYIYRMEFYSAERNKELLPFWESMDETGEHYAKWNKPGSEGQISYDLTNQWNIINKTNKQAKYNQRHWNEEQTDSNQRGQGSGIIGDNKEKAISEHVCIKDAWTKPKGVGSRVGCRDGWGRGAWWGENGDNCTWTTMTKRFCQISGLNYHIKKL